LLEARKVKDAKETRKAERIRNRKRRNFKQRSTDTEEKIW